MLKIVFCVMILLATVTCRDTCLVDGRVGTCTEVSLCPAIETEIRAAGNPMPPHIVFKLQKIACGFNSFEPLVCCVDLNENNNKNPPDADGFDRPIWGTVNKQGTGDDKTSADTRINEGPVDITGHRNLDKLSSNCGTMDAYKISNGQRTALYEMPWMVLLYYNTSRNEDTNFNCGGTLINEWYVLTAAHCVDRAVLGERLTLDHVILGEWDVRTDPDCDLAEGASSADSQEACAPRKMDVKIDKVIQHPGYKPQTLFDDIALIRLAEPANLALDTVAPICLPITQKLQREELVGLQVIVAGWGITELGLQSPVLLSVGLRVIGNADCQKSYHGSPRIYDKQLCAGGEQDKDSCGGDSGGPLMYPGIVKTGGVKQVQRGVVSYGSKRCGGSSLPGVYTNVAYYMDWILNNIS